MSTIEAHCISRIANRVTTVAAPHKILLVIALKELGPFGCRIVERMGRVGIAAANADTRQGVMKRLGRTEAIAVGLEQVAHLAGPLVAFAPPAPCDRLRPSKPDDWADQPCRLEPVEQIVAVVGAAKSLELL
jgi:hypothetical protein